MQRSTLDSILELVPLSLRRRYGGDANRFWVAKYNALLGELERIGTGPDNVIQFPVPWQMIKQGEVQRPPQLADITKAFYSTGDEIEFKSIRGGIWLDDDNLPATSVVVDMNEFTARRQRVGKDLLHLNSSATVLGNAILIHSARGNSQPGEYNPNDFPTAGWVISFTAPTEYMGSGGNPIGIPMEAGEYDWPILWETDFYWTFSDFLILEGHRAYHRITSSADTTSLSPVWDDMVAYYLRICGEGQTDQNEGGASQWETIWKRSAARNEWVSYHAKKPASAMKPAPRPGFALAARR